MRPNIKQSSAEKVFRYFFGETWKNYQAIELAIRNGANKINLFDDENYVWNAKTQTFKTFNWNADPSAYRIGGESIAILRTGVHFYTISYHHISNNQKRYVALRPNTKGAELLVWRYDASGKLYQSIGIAINQHAGGDRTTGSRGCQTAPRNQYGEFITFIGNAFNASIPLGIQKRAEDRFLKGIGNIPYILITQAQFNYILALRESEFDSQDDLRYQIQNFVNVPKIQPVKPTVLHNPAAVSVITKLEAEELEENELTPENVGDAIESKRIESDGQSVIPSVISMETNLIDDFSQSSADLRQANPVEQSPAHPIQPIEEKSKDYDAFIPQISTAKRALSFLGTIFSGGMISSFYAGLPQWIVIIFAVLLMILVVGAILMLIKYHDKVFDYVTEMNTLRADKTKHNPILTTEKK